ncbi:MAG: hypothetical protein JKY48_09085 [Flavobacteriales bacterium]|nr:hypothetical protein [Flavobacteriales bacterium]
MKRPGLFEGIAVAFIASAAGSAIFVILTSLFSGGSVFRFLIAGLSFAYVVYLLARSNERTGRVTAVGSWFVTAIAAWIFAPSMLIYITIHLILLWLIRSLYFYNSVLSALADLGLSGFALIAAIWAWSASNSLFLAFWCFFLVQALFVLIPRHWTKAMANRASETAYLGGISATATNRDQFETAHAAAERALRKLMASGGSK